MSRTVASGWQRDEKACNDNSKIVYKTQNNLSFDYKFYNLYSNINERKEKTGFYGKTWHMYTR